ncbi:MAG: hypothetical protein A3B37_00060 [Candidatus Sungbacteria bacterium RIFCSPLOWO2_01_FULL_59_16]|uniref:Uncharacterized protein n=1 Tax=Candidatus Sungbacteria bacterium RIFCSPLOWO2_01_FULL_59_16 TaxID=1802280 RepID=A0A1G2LA32_9BACT|nr:MAG: hypothetical protein A3B37_00060 [Candidatus Sungbacteria bacterium RIFCSPLOWO2_01_FULL_59_16]
MAARDAHAYLEANRGRYGLDTLVAQLRASGYPEAEIQAALNALSAPGAHTPSVAAIVSEPSHTLRKILGWISGFLLGLLIVAGAVAVSGYFFFRAAFGGWDGGSEEELIAQFLIAAGGATVIALGLLYVLFFRGRRRFPMFAWGVLSAAILASVAAIVAWVIILNLYRTYVGGVAVDRGHPRDARRVTDIKQLQLALELYYDQHGRYPERLTLLAPDYLPVVPADPSTGVSYEYEFRPPNGYGLRALLENPENSILDYDASPGDQFYDAAETVAAPPATTQPPTPSTVTVLSPNGGERFVAGASITIRWKMQAREVIANAFYFMPQGPTPKWEGGLAKKENVLVGGYNVGAFIQEQPGMQSTPVHIPPEIPAGTYKLRIYMVRLGEPTWFDPNQALSFDESDASFVVYAKPAGR